MELSAADRLAAIQERIGRARARFGSPPDRVTLVAVSKTFAAGAIVPFLEAGQRVFGENRVQEAKEKWPALRENYPDVELHLIGPLQTNKAREAVALFDVIETLDRDRLAGVLAQEMAKTGTVDFVTRCRREHGLNIVGLMCIPPDGAPPGPYFAQMVALGEAADVAALSMGMSGDFEVAIGMGASHVRVGSALFGGRPAAG